MYQSFYNSSDGLCCHLCQFFLLQFRIACYWTNQSFSNLITVSLSDLFFPKKVNNLINMLVTKILTSDSDSSTDFSNIPLVLLTVDQNFEIFVERYLPYFWNAACVKLSFATNSLLLVLWKPFFRKKLFWHRNNFLLLASPFFTATRTLFFITN